jgi:hypothetical protein
MSKARQLAQKPSQPTGRKNLIYNGAMQVFQRGNSKDTISNDDCTADRWAVQGVSGLDQANVDYDRTGVGQTDTSVPDGFANALKISLDASETTLESSEYVILLQKFEGQDFQHLRKGFSDAKKLTLSFWVRSSVASTYTVEFKDGDNTRNIGKTYTVNAADTWEYKTITIEGDTTGKLDNDNNLSFMVIFWLDAGSAFTSGTFSTAWQAQDADERVYNTTGWAESSSPTFYITGVQLEVGSIATEFEHRSFGEELALCQRYFWKTYEYETAVGSVTNDSALGRFIDDYASIQIPYNPMRSQPTATIYNPSNGTTGEVRTDSANKAALITRLGSNGNGFIYVNNSSVGKSVGTHAHLTLEAEL